LNFGQLADPAAFVAFLKGIGFVEIQGSLLRLPEDFHTDLIRETLSSLEVKTSPRDMFKKRSKSEVRFSTLPDNPPPLVKDDSDSLRRVSQPSVKDDDQDEGFHPEKSATVGEQLASELTRVGAACERATQNDLVVETFRRELKEGTELIAFIWKRLRRNRTLGLRRSFERWTRRKAPFPSHLPPLTCRDVTSTFFSALEALDVPLPGSDAGGTYVIRFERGAPLHSLRDVLRERCHNSELAEFPLEAFGQVNPPADITLSAHERRLARIPPSATHFAFCYPLSGMSEVNGLGDDILGQTALDEALDKLGRPAADGMAEPLLWFATYGGFVYLEKCGVSTAGVECIGTGGFRAVAAIAVSPGSGSGLYFQPPQKWTGRFTIDLARKGRFQPITVPLLAKAGAKFFCWINPSERLYANHTDDTTSPSPPQVAPRHGAFVYLFGSDMVHDERDCIFPIWDERQWFEDAVKFGKRTRHMHLLKFTHREVAYITDSSCSSEIQSWAMSEKEMNEEQDNGDSTDESGDEEEDGTASSRAHIDDSARQQSCTAGALSVIHERVRKSRHADRERERADQEAQMW
jgi:hypothetical protein